MQLFHGRKAFTYSPDPSPIPRRREKNNLRARVAIVFILLAALAIRFFRLDGQSLWYDEGTSVALAQRNILIIIQSAAADIHPPLYYILLHVWVRLFGISEIAVRLFSVLAGVIVVYLIYLVCYRFFGHQTGLLAAFLSALSPFLVYYSQEARMYMLATLLAALSVYLLVCILPYYFLTTPHVQRRLNRRQVAFWLSYVLVTTAALYTHYFAATVVLAQNVAVILLLVCTLRRGHTEAGGWFQVLLSLLVAQCLVLLLYVPWLPVMLSQFSNWPAISEFYNLFELTMRLFPIFSLGLSIEPATMLLPLSVFAGIALLGVLPHQGESYLGSPNEGARWGERGIIIALSWLFIPILVMFILSLRRPLYNPKFLLVAMPAFYLLLGRGLWQLISLRLVWGKAAAAIALLVLTSSSLLSLRNYYVDPRYARDDYRGITRAITAAQRSGDAIILNAPGQIDIFSYYYQGSYPIYPLPRQRPLDERATIDELNQIISNHQRLWVVYYGDQQADPHRVIESWLDKYAFKASDRWYGDARLALYVLAASTHEGIVPVNARFGQNIMLLGYRLGTEWVTAGDMVPVTLYWQAESAVIERYKVFVHIINRHDTLWGQCDSEPGGGLRPTTTWQQGETIQDNYGLPILPGTPPGDYQIEVGMYHLVSGQRLPISASDGTPLGDRILIGPLHVERPAIAPSPGVLGIQHMLRATLDGLRLLGYNLARLGQEPGMPEFTSNDVLHLSLYWQAEMSRLRDVVVGVQVLDARGQPVRQRESRPADGDYSTTLWVQGEIVRDQHRLPLSGLAAGRYRLVVVVQDTTGSSIGRVELSSITVR